jgi:hypothetical protein
MTMLIDVLKEIADEDEDAGEQPGEKKADE